MPDHKYEFCVSFDLYKHILVCPWRFYSKKIHSNGVTEKYWKNPGTGTGRYDADPGTGRVFIFIPVPVPVLARMEVIPARYRPGQNFYPGRPL